MEKFYLENFPKTAQMIRKMGGNYEDAKDIFHDAFILFYERMMSSEKAAPNHANAYFRRIAKNLWLKKIQLNDRDKQLHQLWESQQNVNQAKATNKDILDRLELLGEKCLKILRAFYYHQWPLEEITEQFGYRNIRSATVQKHKCLEKVRTAVKSELMLTPEPDLETIF